MTCVFMIPNYNMGLKFEIQSVLMQERIFNTCTGTRILQKKTTWSNRLKFYMRIHAAKLQHGIENQSVLTQERICNIG